MKHFLIIFVTLFLLVGCKTKYIDKPIEIPIIKTEYKHLVDSVYIHDSIFHTIEKKGDTVYDTKNVYKIQYKSITDTLIKTDTITQPIYIKEYIENKPTFIDKVKIFVDYFMKCIICCIILLVCFKLYIYLKSK